MRGHTNTGFTIIELLIGIVVVGILVALTVFMLFGAQDRDRQAKMVSDMTRLQETIQTARDKTGRTLSQITGEIWTVGHCDQEGAGITTPTSTLPHTHNCWVQYRESISGIAQAAGDNSILELQNGDPWGNVYIIDENEGADPAEPCIEDWLSSKGKLFNDENDDYHVHLPLSSKACTQKPGEG